MDIQQIVSDLKNERDRIDAAIRALEGRVSRVAVLEDRRVQVPPRAANAAR